MRRALMFTPPDRVDEAIALLTRARDLVAKQDGWCQGRLGDAEGRVSATGALRRCDPEDWLWHGVAVEMGHALPGGWEYLDRYEADPGRTQADVVAAFDGEIARRQNGDSRTPP